jgi:hypothetical protein
LAYSTVEQRTIKLTEAIAAQQKLTNVDFNDSPSGTTLILNDIDTKLLLDVTGFFPSEGSFWG